MKTFKWTVPDKLGWEFECPGFWQLVLGFVIILFSLLYFSLSGSFWKGVQTYFWDSTTGEVISSEFRKGKRLDFGTVNYSTMIKGELVNQEAKVSRDWIWDRDAKYERWVARYSKGSQVTIFYNDAGNTSLGHWPSASFHFGIQGIITLLSGLGSIKLGLAKRKNSDEK